MDQDRRDLQKKTVVVGLSGGVDSSVAAYLLKQQGYRVIGLFMKNWDEQDGSGACPAEKDYRDVVSVCERLEIPYYSVEFVQEYWDLVFEDFLSGYRRGITPNPDILCNREIKFKHFLSKAIEFGADWIATGHYAQVGYADDGAAFLKKGVDPGKDQSYFLYTLSSEVLSRTLFPIGGLPKAEVRRIAREVGLPVHAKKDSTGICFIGKRDFREFLSRYLPPRRGQFRTLDGKGVGEHPGAHFFTLGQRKGLGLGGQGEPYFVVDKNVQTQVVTVVRGADHPALYSRVLRAEQVSWVRSVPEFPFRCRAKVRYRQKEQACVVRWDGEDRLCVEFEESQRAVTPGQSIVFYDGDICLGGGMITEVERPWMRVEEKKILGADRQAAN